MREPEPMKHGGLSLTRQIQAPRERVYEAWTKLELLEDLEVIATPRDGPAERVRVRRLSSSETSRNYVRKLEPFVIMVYPSPLPRPS